MRAVLVVISALIGLWVALATIGYNLDNKKIHYANLAEARQGGELGEGRAIPALLLPDGATDIVLQYDMDSNERWVTYTFPGPQPVRMSGCTLDAALDIDVIGMPWGWSLAIARLDSNAEKYRCIDRDDSLPHSVEFHCVLVQDSSKGAWSCDSGHDIPKSPAR